ncbi:DUF2497 domain-containing protein [Hellea sp.]|nr:DUF2497 domain-containing protein [Hellea sp.]
MSEQTPDTHNGASDGQDPSMEDILASIRKIIAEDDAPSAEAVETKADFKAPDPVEGDVADLVTADTLDLDILEDRSPEISDLTSSLIQTDDTADIDALIGDMDVNGAEELAIPEIGVEPLADTLEANAKSDDVLDLLIPMDDAEVIPVDMGMDEAVSLIADEPLALEDDILDLVLDDDAVTAEVSSDTSSGGLMGGAAAALGLGGAAATAAKALETPDVELPNIETLTVEDPQDDLSLLLDNMLEDSEVFAEADEPAADEQVIDPAENLLAELELESDEAELSDTDIEMLEDFDEDLIPAKEGGVDPDIILVKSLMADLTEDPLDVDDEESLDETDNVLSVADVDIQEIDEPDSVDIMDEILSASLDDETKLSEEAIPEADFEPFAASIENATENAPSLKEIAAQAEADAKQAEVGLGLAAAGIGAAGLAAVAAANSEEEIEEFEEIIESEDVETASNDLDDLDMSDNDFTDELLPEEPEHIAPEPLIEEIPEMPRAKKTDAIIDEVTETATAGAFASLTNVVEEKATTAERGDRIGDLVMEALQPMLKEWLDANLKGIVERAVTKEVKRISSGK